ncbi:olfactory receptor 1G1-like [Rhinatrema bivittatum]|uniref:olfactory receptor 1G1-like n=1 Tax=Rhinatrema bivittatum TaxID=194408 RepID=UPI00112714D2|nr:olfactory receptor 1G1-like [Rhinatrema bivittatum]
MHGENQTAVTEFILLGLSDLPELQKVLFPLFLLCYAATLLGNLIIAIVVSIEAYLHTPMYFFLGNLSILEILYVSVTIPSMLCNFLRDRRSISFCGCLTQMYFFISFVVTDCFLLTSMAYDRYVAICQPLRYTIIMSRGLCNRLAVASWILGFLKSALHTSRVSVLHFCGPYQINHFFCDFPAVLELSCSDIHLNQMLIFILGGITGLGCFLLILVSYVRIVSTVAKLHSIAGRRKAFSTCSSHLTVVMLYFATLTFTYVTPTDSYTAGYNSLVAMVYSIMNPMLNPLIYSLRNKEVQTGLRRIIGGLFGGFWK